MFFLKNNQAKESLAKPIKLPSPNYENLSVEKALLARRSIRDYKIDPLMFNELSQLLWAAQGITHNRGFRTAPSAGALYPLEVYIVAGNVDSLEPGIYKYKPHGHEIIKIVDGDKRNELCKAALGQSCVRRAPAVIVLTAVYKRVTSKYGERGVRYTHMEVGHASQNICLQAGSLNLGTVVVGAFNDNSVKNILNTQDNEEPLCIMPVGKIHQA